ncbi:IclR family transcriptional regulator [Robbsia sp. Bb-Pol-6]|uniref:IclR family transcriptional regulator n=1 Tax=Robbsia betulipollinis TaxID=2981849 RepID=A0ABT3ZS19_9BURK|nr:IclR family transcriptional regulator [Robbsia betulipollinis]MCY0389346.1 IclR family transcriptional regulator [Robbsia betulipollinis]
MVRSRAEAVLPLDVSPSGVDVIDRVVAILLAFRTGDPPLTLTEIANRTGLYKSTVLRLTAALGHHHLLTRSSDGRYQLGILNYSIGKRYESNLNIGDVLLPLMRDLNEKLGETVAFHIRSGNVRVCLFRIDSRFSVRADVKPGDIQQLERGAGGRVLLAFCGQTGDPYEAIRNDHCYLSMGERDAETAGVSAPVFGPMQELIGAVGIVTPITRMTADQADPFTVSVLDTAARATARLGGDNTGMLAALARRQ